MDYNLDSRAVLSTEREHKNLYSWSIKEIDAKGKQIGEDQIPWAWGLNFEVIELTSSYTVQIEEDDDFEEGDVQQRKVTTSEYLYGKLLPANERRKAGIYSMFGTRRRIEHFGLFIYRVAEGEQERCRLWGTSSYTSEWDFEDVTEPDCIQAYVHLPDDRFDHLMNFVKSSPTATVSIRLSGVAGFYSEWSPSIRTDRIKVLANAKDQKLENPENLDFGPPALGNVREFQITVAQERPLRTRSSSDGADVHEIDNDEPPVLTAQAGPAQATLDKMTQQVASLKKNFDKLQIVLWLIFLALIFHLLK
jgi:hypothetical protein